MKKQDFNKFGGTEFRISEPIKEYYSVLCWINQEQNRDTFLSENFDWNEEFKKYVKEEKIYNYSNDKKIKNRFIFILGYLKKWGFIKKFNKNKKIDFNIEIDKLFSKNILIEDLFLKMMYLNWNEFHSMMDFIFKYEKEKINIDKLRWAFSVFDYKTDKFEEIYSLSKEEILNKIINVNEIKSINSIFKKPPKELNLLNEIFNSFGKNKLIKEEEFIKNKPKFFKYIKKILNIESRQKNINYFLEINKYIKNKNKWNFLFDLKKASIEINIDDEYKNMFDTWLNKFGFVVNNKEKEIFKNDLISYLNLNNLEKINNENFSILKIYKDEKFENIEYPFSFEEVKNILEKIQNNNFNFKNANQNIQNTPNFVLAEYFVNLFFGYKLKLKPFKFKNFCNTRLDNKLFPSFSAPGNNPDFEYFDKENNIQYIIETTIHKNLNELIKNESFPISNHTNNSYIKNNFNNKNKLKIYFINFLNFSSSQIDEMNKVFIAIFNTVLEKIKIKNICFKKFNELKNLESI